MLMTTTTVTLASNIRNSHFVLFEHIRIGGEAVVEATGMKMNREGKVAEKDEQG